MSWIRRYKKRCANNYVFFLNALLYNILYKFQINAAFFYFTVLTVLSCLFIICVKLVFSEPERMLISELRFDEIGAERTEEIMASTFLARQRWIKVERPPVLALFEKFPPMKEMGSAVS
jgi:hypothetical protein